MLRRVLVVCAALPLLAACEPADPVAGSGVGFDNYVDYALERSRRDAELQGSAIDPGLVISDEQPGEGPDQSVIASGAPLDVTGTGTETGAAQQDVATAVVPNNPDISDEQNFEAVSERQTIESDRERLERLSKQYTVVEPVPLPKRRGDRPNVVAYALASNHPVGQAIYTRRGVNAAARAERNCARYVSADLAQEAFLDAGGPDRDRFGLDPDGDGYACGWDPAPFRKVRG